MDELKQNQVIAEELSKRSKWHYGMSNGSIGAIYRRASGTERMLFIKDFTQSLDSCRLLEDVLQGEELLEYADEVITVLQQSGAIKCEEMYERPGYPEDPRVPMSALLLATPVQRCEAFIKMLGKWNA